MQTQMKQREPAMSISEKLAAVEAEALQAQQQPPSSHAEPGRKRKHTNANSVRTRKATRRRSTLSPEELAELMGIE
jgi:DNA-binding transcriptional regulator YiaG